MTKDQMDFTSHFAKLPNITLLSDSVINNHVA